MFIWKDITTTCMWWLSLVTYVPMIYEFYFKFNKP